VCSTHQASYDNISVLLPAGPCTLQQQPSMTKPNSVRITDQGTI